MIRTQLHPDVQKKNLSVYTSLSLIAELRTEEAFLMRGEMFKKLWKEVQLPSIAPYGYCVLDGREPTQTCKAWYFTPYPNAEFLKPHFAYKTKIENFCLFVSTFSSNAVFLP